MDHDHYRANRAVYETAQPAVEDHIQSIGQSANKPETPTKPSFGLDSPMGLLASNITAPIYLHASLRGKHVVWDELLAEVPDDLFYKPALDVGCGRGMVLLKIAQRKKALASTGESGSSAGEVHPAYGIDIFNSEDQTGNSPIATYKNVAAAGVLDHTVLHTASFTEKFPFADGSFSLIASSLAIHNVQREGQAAAVREIARVCAPGGRVIIVDLFGVKDHGALLKRLGWTDVHIKGAGIRMVYGVLPCQILTAVKPETSILA
jgi:ubiquinone/menaquinone biosynthesis C-methylase UbiE